MASMTNKKKTSFKRTEKYQRTGYKFIAPGLLMMVLLIIYPMLYGAYLSFYNTNLVNKWKFVGFKYYLEAFTKPEFYTSVLLTFWFMILVVAGHFIIGFLLASTLNKKFHGRTIFRVIFMLPWLFPETVIALLFTWIMNPMYGVLNSILKSLGIISSNVSWLGSAKFAFPAVVAVCIWKGYPLVMTMILSGLQSISHGMVRTIFPRLVWQHRCIWIFAARTSVFRSLPDLMRQRKKYSQDAHRFVMAMHT